MIASYCDSILDIAALSRGRCRGQPIVTETTGLAEYQAARQERAGVIFLTAHFGSFEAGLAALSTHERDVHVVFRRDRSGQFERLRRQLREMYGVTEVPFGSGLEGLLQLTDALERDGAVAMQGDRVEPGQSWCEVQFLHGTLRLPVGPFLLSRVSGAPIVPVFVKRVGPGRCCVHLEQPITPVNTREIPSAEAPEIVVYGQVLAQHICAHPEQWIRLDPAFQEDLVA